MAVIKKNEMKIFNIFKKRQNDRSCFEISPNVVENSNDAALKEKYNDLNSLEKVNLQRYTDILMSALTDHNDYLIKNTKLDKRKREESSFEIIIIYWLLFTNTLHSKNVKPNIAHVFYDIIYYSIAGKYLKGSFITNSQENYDHYLEVKSKFYIEVLELLPKATHTAFGYLKESIVNTPLKNLSFKEISLNSFTSSISDGLLNGIYFMEYFSEFKQRTSEKLNCV